MEDMILDKVKHDKKDAAERNEAASFLDRAIGI